MAYFAKIDANNLVTTVVVISDAWLGNISYPASEQPGLDFLASLYGAGVWKQTSRDGSFRKNPASIGFTYDAGRDAFISPKPFPSWTLNEASCQWQAPVAYPNDGALYSWNEATLSWVKMV